MLTAPTQQRGRRPEEDARDQCRPNCTGPAAQGRRQPKRPGHCQDGRNHPRPAGPGHDRYPDRILSFRPGHVRESTRAPPTRPPGVRTPPRVGYGPMPATEVPRLDRKATRHHWHERRWSVLGPVWGLITGRARHRSAGRLAAGTDRVAGPWDRMPADGGARSSSRRYAAPCQPQDGGRLPLLGRWPAPHLRRNRATELGDGKSVGPRLDDLPLSRLEGGARPCHRRAHDRNPREMRGWPGR